MLIKTEDALGKVLSEDVFSNEGSLILPAGITLSQALINALSNQHITEVEVSDGPISTPEINDTQTKIKTDNELEFEEYVYQLFVRHRGQFMKEFQECLLKQQNTKSNG